MRKLFTCGAALCVCLMFLPIARAQEVNEIVEKAIKAHGGAEKLDKLKSMGASQKSKGKLELFGGIEFTMEASMQPPNKIRSVMELSVMGQNVKTIQVFDGEKFYLNVNGMDLSAMLDEKALEEVKEQIYQERVVGLAFLKSKDVELSPLGENTLEGKACVGVRVASKGHKDTSLWFDKGTGLLYVVESRSFDLQTKEEKAVKKIMHDYKEVDGYLRPTRVNINQDDKKFMELEILEVKLSEKLDDSLFAKP